MHPDCSIACMKAHGVKPIPARYSLRDDKYGIMWLETDLIVVERMERIFPEYYRGAKGEVKRILARSKV